jgi:hypothetical protein
MTERKWELMFTETAKNDMQGPRTRCMFIDQIYHGGHKNLYESLYANFSLFHQVIWSFRSMMYGKQNDKLKTLVKSFSENKNSNQSRIFYRMQCTETYGDQTLVMNSVQKILMQETNIFRNLEDRTEKWYQPEFLDDTFKKRYEGDFLFYKRLNKTFNNIRYQIMRFFQLNNQKFLQVVWTICYTKNGRDL